MKNHSYTSCIVVTYFIVIICCSSCQKSPFNSLNQYVGEWEFHELQVTRDMIMDSTFIVVDYDTTKSTQRTDIVKISVKGADELCFRYEDGRRGNYIVNEDGSFSRGWQMTQGERLKHFNGQLIGHDSLHIRVSQDQSDRWVSYVTTISGKKRD